MNRRLIKTIAYLNLFSALGIIMFWIGFYTELIFPVETLSTKIANFQGYYAWETSFTLPDLVLAISMIIGSLFILKNIDNLFGKLILISASGACIFLGLLDFMYDFRNGMYTLNHIFSYILLSIGIGLPILGVASIVSLIKSIQNKRK